MSKLGDNIKKIRQQRGISQDKLSKLADMSANTVAKLEIDPEPNPTLETLQSIARALNVSVDDLIS